MLQRLSDDIRECYLRADECRRHADETVDPQEAILSRHGEALAPFGPKPRIRGTASSFVKAARPPKP
jgi:hypothetical protein